MNANTDEIFRHEMVQQNSHYDVRKSFYLFLFIRIWFCFLIHSVLCSHPRPTHSKIFIFQMRKQHSKYESCLVHCGCFSIFFSLLLFCCCCAISISYMRIHFEKICWFRSQPNVNRKKMASTSTHILDVWKTFGYVFVSLNFIQLMNGFSFKISILFFSFFLFCFWFSVDWRGNGYSISWKTSRNIFNVSQPL